MQKGWKVAFIVALVVGVIWYYFRPSPSISEEDGDNEVTAEISKPIVSSPPAPSEPPTGATSPLKPEESKAFLQENFSKAISGLQICLKFKNPSHPSDPNPTLDNLMENLKPELGDTVLQSEDWTNTHITLPNGEKRRIRVETEMAEDDRIVRRLKYASVDKEDLPVPIPLNREQSEEPSETFIASLEREGEISLVEKAERFYFQDGSEAMVIQRNANVSEIEISKSGLSYRCWKLDAPEGRCECL